MSVKQGWLPTFTKIKKKPLISVKNPTFVPKPQPTSDFSHLPLSLENVCLFANFRGRKKYEPMHQGMKK